MMDVLHPRCAGLDVHKETVVACALWSGPGGTTEQQTVTFGTDTFELERLAAWLLELDCREVAMEATGVYWKPVFNILEEYPALSPWVLNPEHIKNVPGKKTDVNDAEWIATLLRYGLARASFIPQREQRDTRELTRLRSALVHEKTAGINRLQKTLEAANIKLASVLSDIRGLSGQRILGAVAAGEDDPAVLAGLADFRVRATPEAIERALTGRLTPTLLFVVRQHLQHLAELDAAVGRCEQEIARLMRPFELEVGLLDGIPGIDEIAAYNILAETGTDMGRFESHRHLAAWGGLAPGNKRSGGKQRRAPTRKGSPWLKGALYEAAAAAIRKKDGFLNAMYHRIAGRRGHKRALVAVAHQILVIIYHLLVTRTDYQELGGAYFDQRDHDAIRSNSVRRLERLGYQVELTPVA
jgi:transposase